jgi:hypothetical protein
LSADPVSHAEVVLLPDAGPLITLAYADALDLLLRPQWSVHIVDMVLHEVTRTQTPSSARIAEWASRLPTVPTQVFQRYTDAKVAAKGQLRKAHLGELAIQECMNEFALSAPDTVGVFLFEDHKVARASFLIPGNCRKISTRAYLLFLEQRGLLDAGQTAASVERAAIRNGRSFSRLHFPPP